MVHQTIRAFDEPANSAAPRSAAGEGVVFAHSRGDKLAHPLRRMALLAALAVLGACGASAATCPGSQVSCGGACVDTAVDNGNCGSCGNACSSHTACAAGTCASTCGAGTVLCDGQCVNPLTDAEHCGASGSCTGASAGQACAAGELCSSGTCQATCPEGLLRCGGQCVDPLTDGRYCGAAGSCTGASAGKSCGSGEVCSGGACSASCAQGLVRCGGSCVDPGTSTLFCGASGDCTGPNGGAACAGGQVCAGGACACPAATPNACGSGAAAFCTNFATDPSNCGSCGANCGTGQFCSSGRCAQSCPAAQASCSAGSGPGYCADLSSDAKNCGACAHACPGGQSCVSGQCACPAATPNACSTGSGAYCANFQSDPLNCGACGSGCFAGQACSGGSCTCTGGQTACPAANPTYCASLGSDAKNCGACGNSCGTALTCTSGACTCPAATPDPCGSGSSATCVNFLGDPKNCGACGAACGAAQSCTNGGCTCPQPTPNACGSGAAATCTNFQTDPKNCGNCGAACAATQVCSNGACGCPAGQTSCASGSTTYCTSLQTDASNCGACGKKCASDQVCSAGACVTGGRVLYTGDRTQSPITADIAARISSVSAATTGLRAPVFMKVGDSITYSTSTSGVPAGYFMVCFDPSSGATVNLGARPDLATAVSYFQSVKATATETPFGRVSLAAYPGVSADWSYAGCPNCPLLEERAAVLPGSAVVMYGSNDSLCCGCGLTDGAIASAYFGRIRTIVDTLLANGVVPIVSSMPPRTDLAAAGCDGKQLGRATLFVNATRAIAQARRVPFIDYFREMWPLPNNGLSDDLVHPSLCSDTVGETCRFDATVSSCGDQWLHYGYNVRNLVTLDALDRVRHVVSGAVASLDSGVPRMQGSGTAAAPFVANQLPFADVRNTATDGQKAIQSYSCAGSRPSPGPEVVYELVLASAKDLRIAALDGDYASQGPFTLTVATAADGTGCLASSDRFLSIQLPAGTYYVIVDTVATTGAEFGLVIQECVAGGPQCPTP